MINSVYQNYNFEHWPPRRSDIFFIVMISSRVLSLEVEVPLNMKSFKVRQSQDIGTSEAARNFNTYTSTWPVKAWGSENLCDNCIEQLAQLDKTSLIFQHSLTFPIRHKKPNFGHNIFQIFFLCYVWKSIQILINQSFSQVFMP